MAEQLADLLRLPRAGRLGLEEGEGADTSTSVATVAMAMPTAAMAVLRVRKSRMAKAAMAATDRSAWLMPAR